MITLILPHGYLSFSSVYLWLTSREAFRKHYYPKIPPPSPSTIFMRYGNEVTFAMEKKEDWVSFIPCYSKFELPLIDIDIDGVLMRGSIDNIDFARKRFREQKTTMSRWSKNKIDKHIQLDIYSLLLQEKYGKVCNTCSLVWVETQMKEKTTIMDGIELTGLKTEPTLSLTGKFEETKRKITQEDRDAIRELIGRVAREISEDYQALGHLYP